MKDYIRDDGKIRNCHSNIAKMNVLEYLWFDLVHNKVLRYGVLDTLKQYGTAFEELFFALLNTVMIIFFPISLAIKAINVVKHAKEEVEKHKKMFK